jgi:hypothetical protein
MLAVNRERLIQLPARHSTERVALGQRQPTPVKPNVDPALPRSVLCLPAIYNLGQ